MACAGKKFVIWQGGAVVCLGCENIDATLGQLLCHTTWDVDVKIQANHEKAANEELASQGRKFQSKRRMTGGGVTCGGTSTLDLNFTIDLLLMIIVICQC